LPRESELSLWAVIRCYGQEGGDTSVQQEQASESIDFELLAPPLACVRLGWQPK
jgi:hypothetical protein